MAAAQVGRGIYFQEQKENHGLLLDMFQEKNKNVVTGFIVAPKGIKFLSILYPQNSAGNS